MLLVVCHTLAVAQPQDLTPLLPPADSPIRQALLAGNLPRAAQLAAAAPSPARDLWQGIFAILRNDAPAAIRTLRPLHEPKALGVAYYLLRQHLLFRDQMAEAIRRNPDDFGPYYYLGRHYDTDVNDPAEAVRWFRLALARNPASPRLHAFLGNCLERSGNPDEAAAHYAKSPGQFLSQLGLARLRLAANDPASALPHAEKALALEIANPQAAKLAARIYADLNRPADAIKTLEAAAPRAPADAAIHYQLFRLYQSAGDAKKAAAARSEFQRLQKIYGIQP